MSKKLMVLLLITGMILTLGCTGTNQGAGTAQPTATPATATAEPGATSVITPAPDNSPSPADNESTPELDLPLPPDLSDL